MKPSASPELLAQAARWEDLTRWERAEMGRALRRLGWTYGEIRSVFPVPTATLAGWCREIRLTPDQIDAIERRTYGSRLGVPVDTKWRRRQQIAEIRKAAREEVPRLAKDPLWVAGVMLYWGEGAKADRRLSIANSDARLLNLFILWTRTFIMGQPSFVLSLNLHQDNDESTAKAHWRSSLDLRVFEFTKTFTKPDGTGHRKNHLRHGVCRVRLRRSTNAWPRVMEWIEATPPLLREPDRATATLASGR